MIARRIDQKSLGYKKYECPAKARKPCQALSDPSKCSTGEFDANRIILRHLYDRIDKDGRSKSTD